MKSVAPFIAALLFVGCATTEPPKPMGGMHLEDQLEACRGAGGCTVSSQAHLMDLMQQTYEKGRRDAVREQKAACWANTKRFDGDSHL